MYNKKILTKALSSIVKKGKNSKYKICTTQGTISQGYIYILYADTTMYIVPNILRLSIENPKITFGESTAKNIIDGVEDIVEIRPNGHIINDLTEFTDRDGNKIYAKTKLLKNLDKHEYYYTYGNSFIHVYDSPAKRFLYAIIIEARPRYSEISGESN